MAKKKIAILGAGMAGLSAAYQLTKTPELRALHEVTVYQMGWRLGGKAASGRDSLGRNLEHGLHVWFGCYENVFQMIQEIYAIRTPPPNCPLQHWTDVARPQVYTPIGVETNGTWAYFPLTWPTNDGTPGDGKLNMTPAEALQTLWNLFLIAIRNLGAALTTLDGDRPAAAAPSSAPPPAAAQAPTPLAAAFAAATSAVSRLAGSEIARAKALIDSSHAVTLPFDHLVEAASLWNKSLIGTAASRDAAQVEQLLGLLAQSRAAFEVVADSVPPAFAATDSAFGLKLRMFRELFDIFQAGVRGYYADLIGPDEPYESLDNWDFRAWLIHHGANPDIVATSTVVRIVYDTLFQYADGDGARPSYAAGTALGVIVRLIGTYKGAMMWDIQAGMGEAAVAPLYEVLLANDVKFQFFCRVTQLELSADKKSINRIRLARQAATLAGAYRPTYPVCNLTCWPSEPFWDQLKDGPAMQAAGVNFESHWCNWPTVEEVLAVGTHFDTVVLAISMGAYKPLNAEPGMCDDLIAQGGAFANFVNKIGIVPTQGLQLWCDQTTEELGWTTGKAATVSGPEYLNIWADMTQVLAVEPWTGYPKPKSLHYLCGTYKTTIYMQPSTNIGVPAAAQADLRTQALGWLNTSSVALWPIADNGTNFNFNVLTDVNGGTGVARFDAQFLRANVDPTECCVLSAAGTTQYRLHPDQSGFTNLILAGEATRHGFNTTAIEGAVMSGMAASRAICGQPATIVGYDFLQRKPSDISP